MGALGKKVGTVVLIAAFIVASLPQVTGVAAHEWLGLVLVVVLLLHAARNSARVERWLRHALDRSRAGAGGDDGTGAGAGADADSDDGAGAGTSAGRGGGAGGDDGAGSDDDARSEGYDARARRAGRIGRVVLDVGILVVLAVCAVSGMMISGAVLPAFGLFVEGYYLWKPLHAASAKLLLALLVVHVALNARVFARRVRRDQEDSADE